MNKPTLGVIVGNRGFFPATCARRVAKTMLKVLKKEGINAIASRRRTPSTAALKASATPQKCADLFKKHADEIDGILVTLPNFGDERAIANAIRWSGLNVPVLIHAYPDDATKMTIADRRDSFCGKMSTCNNLQPVRHPLLADHAAHASTRRAQASAPTCAASSAPAASCAG